MGFNTQPPEGGWAHESGLWSVDAIVSTHSRLKAAGRVHETENFVMFGFNTQPPEGGWVPALLIPPSWRGFNTQPPEGGWLEPGEIVVFENLVSTHSRLKAAGYSRESDYFATYVSTHSRLKAAGSTPMILK